MRIIKHAGVATVLFTAFAASAPTPKPKAVELGDSLKARMTMYYDKDVATAVDPASMKPRMTMYYDKDVATAVDPASVKPRMTMYYDKDVAVAVDPAPVSVSLHTLLRNQH